MFGIVEKMFKSFWILIFFIMGVCNATLSQQLSHQVIVPLAGLASDRKVSYSQTVGETAVEIIGCTQYLFTQGFQQPSIKFSSERRPEGNGVKVYPNPATDYLIIELFGEKPKTFRIDIINITGNVVFSEMKIFSGSFWYREPQNISDLISGFYIVRVLSADGLVNRTFKIEKI
jgi:hypothetical protein